MAKDLTLKLNFIDKATGEINESIKSIRKSANELTRPFEQVSRNINLLTNTALFALGAKGIATVVNFGKACSAEFLKVERASFGLQNALEASGISVTKINGLINSLAKVSNSSDDDLLELAKTLAQLGMGESEIEKMLKASTYLANTLGTNVNDAYTKLNATLTGTGGKLEKVIPELGNFTEEQLKSGAAVDLVIGKLGKYSDALSVTASQKVKNFNEALGNLKEAIGGSLVNAFAPSLTVLQSFIDKLTESVSRMNTFDAITAKMKAGIELTTDEEIARLEELIRNREGLLKSSSIVQDENTARAIRDQLSMYSEALGRLRQKLAWEALNAPKDNGAKFNAGTSNEDSPAQKAYKAFEELQKGYTKALALNADGYDGLLKIAKDFKGKFEDAMYDFKDSLGPEGKNIADALIKSIKENIPKLVNADVKNNNSSVDKQKQIILDLDGITITNRTPTASGISSTDDKLTSSTSPLALFSGSMQGILNSLTSGVSGILGGALNGLSSITAGLIPNMASLSSIVAGINPLLLLVKPIIDGFISVMGPAINKTLAPIFNALNRVGSMLAEVLLPILEAVTPIFEILGQVIISNVSMLLQFVQPALELVAGVLSLLSPILKGVAIAFEILMSPVRWLADLFSWVAKMIRTAVHNFVEVIEHPFRESKRDTWSYESFSSDAFTGLDDRINRILGVGQTDLNPSTYGGYQSTVGASYANGTNVTVNQYFYVQDSAIVGNNGMREFADMIKMQIEANLKLAV